MSDDKLTVQHDSYSTALTNTEEDRKIFTLTKEKEREKEKERKN